MHKINLDDLKKETGLSIEGIGELAQMKNPKGVYNWSKDQSNHGTRPSYNAIVRLLGKGATPKTLFGVDVINTAQNDGKPIQLTDEDLSRAFLRAAQILGEAKK